MAVKSMSTAMSQTATLASLVVWAAASFMLAKGRCLVAGRLAAIITSGRLSLRLDMVCRLKAALVGPAVAGKLPCSPGFLLLSES